MLTNLINKLPIGWVLFDYSKTFTTNVSDKYKSKHNCEFLTTILGFYLAYDNNEKYFSFGFLFLFFNYSILITKEDNRCIEKFNFIKITILMKDIEG